jgi:cell shape-determining protein MreD
MIVTPGILGRMAIGVLLALLLQNAFFSMIEVLGVSIWILPAFVTSFGLLGGRTIGLSTGFLVGLLSDLTIDAPLGSSSLAFMAVGYVAGALRERSGLPGVPFAGLLSGVATVVASLLVGLILAGVGQGAGLAWPALPEVVLQGLYGVLIGMPIFMLFRRLFAPALVADRPARRRHRDSVLGV